MTNILAAAAKEASVKRVVMTSSALVVEAKNGAQQAGREWERRRHETHTANGAQRMM